MPRQTTAPYGSWSSPIAASLISEKAVRLDQIVIDGDDLYWTEERPLENGRLVIVRHTPDGKNTDLTPPNFNVRTRVHEYGGGAFTVQEGTIYFTNFADQRLYRQDPEKDPIPLTPAVELRYADMIVDPARKLIYSVREDHTVEGEAANTLVALDLNHENPGRVIADGFNFYSSPRLSPNGNSLAWLAWNHPNMPWDGPELWVGDLHKDGSLGKTRRVAGAKDISIFQPEWSADGLLYYISDRTGWWNLYRLRDGQEEPLCPMEAEFGVPQWVFGLSTYAFISNERLVTTYIQDGETKLAILDTSSQRLTPIRTNYQDISQVHVSRGQLYFIGGSPSQPASVVQVDLATHHSQVLRPSRENLVDPAYISTPEPIEFPTENGLSAHAYYYAPKNPNYIPKWDERPPLILTSHGGPTASASTTYPIGYAYFTSRGFAVLDVNYGGSTRYGRAYRQRLNGQWGVVDVDDCVNGALYLVKRGLVDENRLAIRGGSASGYTTLCAITFRDVFKAAASHFGIGNLETFISDTHKFEARYLDTLVGPYPERKDVYHARSPIYHAERITCPLILFQGLEDKIVPPNQAEMMHRALLDMGIPVAYLPFEGEGHGFRKAENITRALEAELYFYSRIFGFPLAEPIEPVKIENLD